jgi:hypothetical protein
VIAEASFTTYGLELLWPEKNNVKGQSGGNKDDQKECRLGLHDRRPNFQILIIIQI